MHEYRPFRWQSDEDIARNGTLLITYPELLPNFIIDVRQRQSRLGTDDVDFNSKLKSIYHLINRHNWAEELDRGPLTTEQASGLLTGLASCRSRENPEIKRIEQENHGKRRRQDPYTHDELITFSLLKGFVVSRHEAHADRVGLVKDMYTIAEQVFRDDSPLNLATTFIDLYHGDYPRIFPISSNTQEALALSIFDPHPDRRETLRQANEISGVVDQLSETVGRADQEDKYLARSIAQNNWVFMAYMALSNHEDVRKIFRLAYEKGATLRTIGEFFGDEFIEEFNHLIGPKNKYRDEAMSLRSPEKPSSTILEIAQASLDFPNRWMAIAERARQSINLDSDNMIVWHEEQNYQENPEARDVDNMYFNELRLLALAAQMSDPTPLREALEQQADQKTRDFRNETNLPYESVPFADIAGLSGIVVLPFVQETEAEKLDFARLFMVEHPDLKDFVQNWTTRELFVRFQSRIHRAEPEKGKIPAAIYITEDKLAPLTPEALFLKTHGCWESRFDQALEMRAALLEKEQNFPKSCSLGMADRGHKYVLSNHPELGVDCFEYGIVTPYTDRGFSVALKLGADNKFLKTDHNSVIHVLVKPGYLSTFTDILEGSPRLPTDQQWYARLIGIRLAEYSIIASRIPELGQPPIKTGLSTISEDGGIVAVGGTKIDRLTGNIVPKGWTTFARDLYDEYHTGRYGPENYEPFEDAVNRHQNLDEQRRIHTWRSPVNGNTRKPLLREAPEKIF